MDVARVYFGDDFGQKIDLTVRIREILRNYPEGTSIFKELVQNADDAGATEVAFCLDMRQHSTEHLAYKKMEKFQGPSLVVFNNATFSDADFQSIQRIGDSLKKDNSKGWKTGRFGIGFNSVYHLTDLPAFVSGSHLVFFDPQACHLPNVNPSNPGKMINFISHPEIVTTYPAQVAPFKVFGCDFTAPFDGTVFRLALRTKEQAQVSRLSSRPQTPQHLLEMLQEFAESIHLVLLFLRNVSKIKLLKWEQGMKEPVSICEASISNLNEELRDMRSLRMSMPKTDPRAFDISGQVCDYFIDIEVKQENGSADVVKYLVANQLGGGECSRIANDPANANQRLVPWGGIAARLPREGTGFESETGLAFCFLPLPTQTYLPVHVNGYFELSSNRRDVWFGDGLSGDGLLRATWNIRLLEDVIAPCYARAVISLTTGGNIRPDLHVSLLPHLMPPSPWNSLAQAFLRLIKQEQCLYSLAKGGVWVAPSTALILNRNVENYEPLVKWLLDDGLPIVSTLSEEIERVFVSTRTILSYLEPKTLRDVYRERQSVHAGKREAIRAVLSFVFRDITPSDTSELIGVNLLPISDSTLKRFEKPSENDMTASLEYLCSMGFSRAHSVHALKHTGGEDVEAALNWLFANPHPAVTSQDGSLSESSTYFIATDQERCILSRAQAKLVDLEALPDIALKVLSTSTSLNVRTIDIEGFEDLLSSFLPQDWYGKATVPWTPANEYFVAFDEDWFRLLWAYLGQSAKLGNLQDKWPILPTSSGILCMLSPRSGVLSPELLPPACLTALSDIGVPVLLKNLFATINPHPVVWNYVHQPTPAGVLTALTKLCEEPELEIKKRFRKISHTGREQLRAFLLSDESDEFDSTQKMTISKLPLFEGVVARDSGSELDVRWGDIVDPEGQQDAKVVRVFVSLYSASRRDRRMMCPGIKWEFLDESFIHVTANEHQLINALRRMGVTQISKAKFFSEHLIPRLERSSAMSIDFTRHLLRELSVLLADDHDGELTRTLESAAIFPTMNGELKRISDLFDPEIEEFAKIMDGSFFPAGELHEPQPLSLLRSLGLQRQLSRRSILALACSIEDEQGGILNGDKTTHKKDELAKMLTIRATEFFKYINSHFDQLVTVSSPAPKAKRSNIKAKSFKLWRSFVRDENGDTNADQIDDHLEQERKAMEQSEIDDFVAKMYVLAWVPVSYKKPSPTFPWYRELDGIIVASPDKIRLRKETGLCSSQYHILDASVHSDSMRVLFRWDDPVPAEVVAQQLKAIALSVQGSNDLSLPQTLWPVMYNVYKTLSRFFESETSSTRRESVLSLLAGDYDSVWVGGRFVAPHRVAVSTVLNAEPHLFAVPSELIHFRPFLKAIGVRERFSLTDYVEVLGVMYRQSRLTEAVDNSTDGGSPLPQDELATAIGLIQLICDTLSHHADYEIYAPDLYGVLTRSVNLTYDDAPWLDKRDIDLRVVRLIHPKVSNDVGSKIGAKSLRSLLLHANQSESLLFSVGAGVEAFGQTEALTKRISHILEQYPDGPHIVSELIQNADDAGATRVCLMYSGVAFGTSSLLSPAMSKWQGPALYCYNDAEFRESDFVSLARIGQGGKLQRVSTTGRFGLGFNSVYHFTDLPSVVSANSLVMFDPHATHLPGITPSNPGIKIRFVNSSLQKQFPDQFEPFKVLGCDFENHFHGTLFRFPLRDASNASASEIKQRAYTTKDVFELFESFRGTISESLIFLRNVQKVDVMVQFDKDHHPVLLYSAEVPVSDRGDAWHRIDRFVDGEVDDSHAKSNARPAVSSKVSFYSRLSRTATSDLPSVTQKVRIHTRERSSISAIWNQENPHDMLDTDEAYRSREETFLVYNQIGAGRAREIACAPENVNLKLIPWVGVACRLEKSVEGRAFCFLPLPVRTGLPVHVNGYFELSSNRRDVWHGDDLAGEGKLRSEWNAALITDAIAPAYAEFLLQAKQNCTPSVFLSLFPDSLPSAPWNGLVRALYSNLRDKPVLSVSSTATRNANKPISPASSVLVDETIGNWDVLEQALNSVFIDTVRVSAPLRRLLVDLDVVHGSFTPSFLRKLVRSERFLPSLDPSKVSKVIEFCLSDCHEDSRLIELDQLPIVPVVDGSFKQLRILTTRDDASNQIESALFFANHMEIELLGLFWSRLISYEFKSIFDGVSQLKGQSNIAVIDLVTLSKRCLPEILPLDWRESATRQVFWWDPTKSSHPSREWLKRWWSYIDSTLDAADDAEASAVRGVVCKWPLLPILMPSGALREVVIQIGDSSRMAVIEDPSVHISSELVSVMPGILSKLGVATVNRDLVRGRHCIKWLCGESLLYKLDLEGVLSALSNRLARKSDGDAIQSMFSRLESSEIEHLLNFFTSLPVQDLKDSHMKLLRRIPIFPVFSSATTGEDAATNYRPIESGGRLPGDDVDTRVLDSSFFVASKGGQTWRFLEQLGVEEWNATRILLDYVFPQICQLEAAPGGRELVDSIVRCALIDLPFHQRQDSRFRDVLKSMEIIPTRKKLRRRVVDLYDPNNRDLSELVGPNSLPHESMSSSDIVDILRSLGLRGTLSCHAILESARSIEVMYEDESSTDDAWRKAHSLLKVVNRSFDEMATMTRGEHPDNLNQESAPIESVDDIVNSLRRIRWLPVRSIPPKSLMPWPDTRTGTEVRLANPEVTRPDTDAWQCSASLEILDGPIHSEILSRGFGWDVPVSVEVVASQIAAIGEQVLSEQRNGQLDISSTDFKLLLHEVQRIYQVLDTACLAVEEDQKETIRQKIEPAPWVWTGKCFTRLQHVAAEADSELEPLLFAAPPDVLVPRTLLDAFGLKPAFEKIDYVLALKALSESSVALRARQKAVCLKLLDRLSLCADSASDSTIGDIGGLLLLDEHDRLVPARELTYDDMEWNESSEVRRGCRFVSKSIPREIALKFGASSLHSKLAESSASSTRVICPGSDSLLEILPKRERCFEAFFSEALLAAERLGGSQVDFFVDYRRHPSQRVIQPSFQSLQDEAICIHIHDLVMSTEDVNALFAGVMSRSGLLTGFFFSDCLQILSGDGFYVLDPNNCFLSSSASADRTASTSSGTARRYDILSEEFVRYPDQLLPFCTLPSCPGNMGSGTRSTLLRFPWRKEPSSLGQYTPTPHNVEKLVAYIRAQLADCLVFTEAVHRVSVCSVGKGSEFAVHFHGEASLDNADETLKRRNATRHNNDWKKKFSFHSFFKNPVTPENQLEFVIKLEIENKRHNDTWLLSDNISAGRSRDLASSPIHEVLNSIPYVGVACRLFRDGEPASPIRGKVYRIIKTDQDVGLPVHINGCFKKQLNDSKVVFNLSRTGLNDEQSIAVNWNRVLLEDGVVDAYWKMILIAKHRFESTVPRAFYRIWPTMTQSNLFLAAQVQSALYRKVGSQDLFLCTDGTFRSLNGGYVVDIAGMDLQVISFAQLHFPSFDVPKVILDDLKRLLPSRVFSLSPKTMRRFLRNFRTADISATMCLSLLEYCLSDMTFPLPGETHAIWSELQGLPLLPLEDGSVGLLGMNQRGRYVLATYNQIQLLQPVAHMFVSLEARQRLHAFFTDSRFVSQVGLNHFSIKTLSDNLDKVLPGSWRDTAVVDWKPREDRSHISQLWLYRFWCEVRFERRSLAYFSSWPLIPIQGSRLLSCGKPDAAVCIWTEAFDQNLRQQLKAEFNDASRANDERLAELDEERKRWRELSTEKFRREDGHDMLAGEESRVDVERGDPDDDSNYDVAEEPDDASGEASASGADDNLDETTDEVVQRHSTAELLEAGSSHEILPETAGTDERGVETNSELSTAAPRAIPEETNEVYSREMMHHLLIRLNVPMLELAYLDGQELEIIPSSRDVTIRIIDGICSCEPGMLRWVEFPACDATQLAEYFSDHSQRHGGYNRMHLERLKRLPIYVNICDVPCALDSGEHFLVPAEIDLGAIPLPPNARQRFMQPNPRLTAFYKELGVADMSYPKLLLFLLPFYDQLLQDQRESVLQLIKDRWQTLRGDADLAAVLRTTPLFESGGGLYKCADAFFDPRNKVLKAIYGDVQGSFPNEPFYSSSEWLDLMGEIGLRSEITVDLFVECAQRLEAVYANKSCLTTQDEAVVNVLHQYFVQNFDKYDRSRVFFERIGPIRFVPAHRYENAVSCAGGGQTLLSRTVLTTFNECATPDDQALVFSTMPILATAALPPRVLWSRLGVRSPPPKAFVLDHLHRIVESAGHSVTESWLFFEPIVDVFQSVFRYLQENWESLSQVERARLVDTPIIPVGSHLVRGNRLFFHLPESLAPLMYEVPRIFGAYDTLFRHLGSKDEPSIEDYVLLLRELSDECGGNSLNLNELVSVARVVRMLCDELAEQNKALSSEDLLQLRLPSTDSVMCHASRMAYNDAPWICARVNLAELRVVHPRVTAERCDILSVRGISCIVSEELETVDARSTSHIPAEIEHMNSTIASQQFGDGLRTIISVQQQQKSASVAVHADFVDLHRRIIDVASYRVRAVDTLRSRFIAHLGHPSRRVDVTKESTATGSVSFVDVNAKLIYVATNTMEGTPGIRATQVIAGCINQILGGFIQDCTAIESILSCDVSQIHSLLRFMHIHEDPGLIMEKLRGTCGELVCETDLAMVELAPLRSFYVGELVAVEHDGRLRYAKIMKEGESGTGRVTEFQVRITQTETRPYLTTQIYSFKSFRGQPSSSHRGTDPFVRLGEVRGQDDARGSGRPADDVPLPPAIIPQPIHGGSAAPPVGVSSATILSAVNDLLSKINMSLDSRYEGIVAENLRLQRRLEQAEEGRRLAAAQVDDALREQKAAQETLICAICLENTVDRVLIPCGHIYCSGCVSQLPRQTCPICRQAISATSLFHVPS